MEFVESQTTKQETVSDNESFNYSAFCKKCMSYVKDENITKNLEIILNTTLKVTQYRMSEKEYVIKLNTQIEPIYFNYSLDFPEIAKCINTKIKVIPKIISAPNGKFKIDFEAWVGTVLLEDIKNILFLKNLAVIYHREEIINKEIQGDEINFINYYPQFDEQVCFQHFSEVFNVSNENVTGLSVKSLVCDFEKKSYNIYNIDIYGFKENMSEDDMETYCQNDSSDIYSLTVQYDKNINHVKVKTPVSLVHKVELSEEKLALNDTSRFYFTNGFGEKFTCGFIPYIKSSKEETPCELVELIDHVFKTKPMIEISYFETE